MRVTLTLNDRHLRVILSSLELYSRLSAGQLEELRMLCPQFLDNFDKVEGLLKRVKKEVFGLDSNTSLGILSGELSENAKIGYEIRKMIDCEVSWAKNPSGGYTVNYDKPLKVSKEELVEVEVEL